MKNLYVILWVINSFIGTGFLSNELQEDEHFFSSENRNEFFKPFAGKKLQHHYKAIYDFDFEYGLSRNEKAIQLPFSEYIIKIYSLVFSPPASILPLLYDLPPPYSMV